jgi:hypothetical protein
VLADDGDGRLGGELFRARPAQAPVPSHSDGTRKRATTMGGGWVKWGSLERSGHALSRSRSFVMKFDGWERDIDDGRLGGSRQADGLTLQCHPVMACFGRAHGLRGSLACPDAVSAGLGIIRIMLDA